MKDKTLEKKPYQAPKVRATYGKEEIEAVISPHGSVDNYIGRIGDIIFVDAN